MKKGFIGLVFLWVAQICCAQFSLRSDQPIKLACDNAEEKVVQTALKLFIRDYQSVFSASAAVDVRQGNIIVGTVGKSPLLKAVSADVSALAGKKQAFLLQVLPDGKLLVAGSDSHGTAYGIMELSRLIGVSPWEWWADVTPEKKTSFVLSAEYQTLQSPSVEYRGIFINDEDWGLMPWSSQTYEPSDIKGHIGPKTNARIFELLLRLRANTYWPAMHECTLPFFLTEGNRKVAEEYGIFIGSSHCEPMVCSAAGEWRRRGQGDYDYVNNSASVYKFWEDRVKEVAQQGNIYTLGMRGVHDGQMQGAKTVAEQKAVLERVLKDQRGLLQKYVNKDVTAIPQAFIPYKEVLDIYNAGLQVPDDVTLIWCDDNYGYIRHFPTAEERARKGGNGIYYHVSYWGRPHDYLWLGTFSPYLLHQQMKLAYDRGIQKMWVLNVGDIKPAEYQIELFLDMAWNIDEVNEIGVTAHLKSWLGREFGSNCAEELLPAMEAHYQLSYIRKPEFMGNTREEERDPKYKVIKDLPWSEQTISERLRSYTVLSDVVERMESNIPADRQDAYFQLVKYPVQAAAQMNRKILTAQLARHSKVDWKQSDAAFDSIASLTQQYNSLQNGKWNRMMDFQPRKLPVFKRVEHTTATEPMVTDRKMLCKWNAMECTYGKPVPYEGLGYERKAAGIRKGSSLTFAFDDYGKDSVEVEIRLLPSHPLDEKQLRFAISVDEAVPQTVSYETKGRSEEWKENVLRNQAIRKVTLPINKQASHKLVITALDEGVVLDQVILY
ncbi:glycosyl hydrolase 115 family protein [Bacteroides cellulosilyticus]|uniref:glycosyl hydrolase 115 family protein n=1 Tax=Bacteroides cellulosilyticus TaxID=246787 RepID=UPI00234DBD3D|nr:glycosyl hydrolase 115 family protein [Bacteroides cellulosilyticus]MDC7175563.1 glycosyl hydrolase 115 family protein [Bacteroides cellulosilyticus]MDC7183037.1 glycosyl hydrolase 115 family protein [Bacteroides cellulosilyticus]